MVVLFADQLIFPSKKTIIRRINSARNVVSEADLISSVKALKGARIFSGIMLIVLFLSHLLLVQTFSPSETNLMKFNQYITYPINCPMSKRLKKQGDNDPGIRPFASSPCIQSRFNSIFYFTVTPAKVSAASSSPFTIVCTVIWASLSTVKM